MILADGARADILKDLLDRGELPAIGEFLVREGSFREAITAFPSTTGPAYLPFLTGCYPGTCNLPGIRWFDKDCYSENRFSRDRFRSYVGAESFYMNRDLCPEIPTIFDLVPRSANIFSSVNRGVGFRGNKTKFSRIWYWYYAHLTDHWGLVDESAAKKILEALKEDPEFVFAVFPAIDEYSHLSSPFHPRTIEAYRELDRMIGGIVKELKKEGRYEETALFIVSDHGLSETKTHLPLNQFLEGFGISTLYYPKILFKWRFEAASMVSGNAMAHVYFKNGHGWRGRATWESLMKRNDRIVERLLERPEVDIVAALSDEGSVVAKSRRGEAWILPATKTMAGSQYYVSSSDPFGYGPMSRTLSDRQLLDLTHATDYPDAPAQLLQIFKSRRAGDLVISAAKGHDLRLRYEIHEHKSSHGSLHWEHMKIPLVANIKLPHGPIRSVDVFPTVMELLGRPIPQGIDGKSLFL